MNNRDLVNGLFRDLAKIPVYENGNNPAHNLDILSQHQQLVLQAVADHFAAQNRDFNFSNGTRLPTDFTVVKDVWKDDFKSEYEVTRQSVRYLKAL